MKLSSVFLVAVAVQLANGQDNDAGEDRLAEVNAEHQLASGGGQTLNTPWDWDRCLNKMCKLGEGDCDSDDQCKDDLVCGHNNCKTMHPNDADYYHRLADCCDVMSPYHLDYCQKTPGCGFGTGDCDDEAGQCAEGLVCGVNNCRAMHPQIDPNLIHHKADCCTTCAAVTAVIDDIAMPQPPMAFTNGKVVTAERTLTNPPSALANAVVHSLPPMSSGDSIKLECCAKEKTPCNFFVAVYHCPPCSRHLNGGIPVHLILENWQGTSCAPSFTPAGSSQSQTMTVFQHTIAAGEHFTIPVTMDAPHVAVFTSTGAVGDWCPRSTSPGASGPHRPCVCI